MKINGGFIKKKKKKILKAFGLKKKFLKWVFLVKINKSAAESFLEKMQNEGRREFLGKKSPGIQDFIFCAKKPGNKYKIQEIWGFCVENRGFAYHRREGGATRSHPVPSL